MSFPCLDFPDPGFQLLVFFIVIQDSFVRGDRGPPGQILSVPQLLHSRLYSLDLLGCSLC